LWRPESARKWREKTISTSPKMMQPERPDRGGVVGKAIKVKVNIFPVSIIREMDVYHYDVKIASDSMKMDLPQAMAVQAMRQCEAILKQRQKDFWIAYDGKSSAYSTVDFTTEPLEVTIKKDFDIVLPPVVTQGGGGRGGARGGRGGSNVSRSEVVHPSMKLTDVKILQKTTSKEYETVKVTFKKVATIELQRLLKFAAGETKEDDLVLTASASLSVFLRYIPSLLFVSVGSNFFTPENRIPLAGGLEIWRGVHQSFKSLLAGHLGINVDIAATVFRKGGISVLDYITEVTNCRDISRLSLADISKALKGVSVKTTHRGDMKQRFRVQMISKETANTFKFKDDAGKDVSVAQYFQSAFSLKLHYPNLPLVVKVYFY
jgi:eukaryotic translation initiation factor 2C